MKAVIVFSIFMISFSLNTYSLNAYNLNDTSDVWEFVTGIKEGDLNEVAIDLYGKKEIIYASSYKRLYRSEDNGRTWRSVFTAKGSSNKINFISITKSAIFICTEKGLFRSSDGLSNWQKIFNGVDEKESSVSYVGFSKDGRIYLGTKDGLFVSKDNGKTWQQDIKDVGSIRIRWVSFSEEDIFVATDKGVYKNTDFGWERIFLTAGGEDDEDDSEDEEEEESLGELKPINSIMIKDGKIFLAGDSGIFVTNDNGKSWTKFPTYGIMFQKIKRLLFNVRTNISYTVTDKGVYSFNEDEKLWKAIYKGMETKDVRSICMDKSGDIWVATAKGLYRTRLDSEKGYCDKATEKTSNNIVSKEKMDILRLFDNEPSIRNVQEAAIRYAEVHPDKIKRWREQAKKKALLPNVSIGMDRNVTDFYHWEGGSTTIVDDDYLRKGKYAYEWDISLTWDMGELIWNDDQTSIDTRSKLMVQLREDILDETTRTYFERRRLQIEMSLSSARDLKEDLEGELRIQELTADLDALTGGYFSSQLSQDFKR